MSELTELSATQIGRLVRQGELRRAEVVDAYLRRAEELNPRLNAITDLQADRAREQAEERDRNGPAYDLGKTFDGAPFTVKSSIAAEGFRHECGTPLRRGVVAPEDAALVQRLKASGAIVIGTTNVPEFLMAYETDNHLYGRTDSPLDPARTPGGSSGGDSAAVAGRLCAGGFGSDAGGSIRVPAHFCGLYGFKPTPGMIPLTGHWPAAAGPATTLAGVGPIARTANDLLHLYAWVRGYDDGDISSVRDFDPHWHDLGIIRTMRVGWFDHAWGTPVTPETRAAVRTAADALKDRGLRPERIELRGLEQAPRVWRQQFCICLKTLIESSVPSGYRLHPLAYDAMASDEEQARFGHEDLLHSWVAQDLMRLKLREIMQRFPILLCPVASVPAFRHGERTWTIEGERVGYPDAFVYSQVFNLLGVPAASVPVGTSPDGLPIGVQVVGRPHEDQIVLEVVRDLEASLQGLPMQDSY